MRKLRQPNSTEVFIPKCDNCGEEIEIAWTGGGLNRWYHVHSHQRYCEEKAMNGEARKRAQYKGTDIPLGRYHRLPRSPNDAEVKESVSQRDDEMMGDLLAITDEIEEKRHRLRNDNGS